MLRKWNPSDFLAAVLILGLLVLRGLGRDGLVDSLLLATGALYLGYHAGTGNGRPRP